MSRILIAYDESPQARAALDHALEIYPGAELVVIHVSDPQEWIYPDAMSGGYYSDDAFERAKASGEELLEAAEAIAADAGRDIATVAETGQTAPTIVEYAEEHDIDHIVMGSHGRRGLSRFLLGSVAEAVLRRSPVSVTAIREPGT